MKTKTKRLKPWNELTKEERIARVRSAYGRFAENSSGIKTRKRDESFLKQNSVLGEMKTKSKRIKPWNKLTQEERVERIHSFIGKYAWIPGTSEDFLREKYEETEREEQRYLASHPDRR